MLKLVFRKKTENKKHLDCEIEKLKEEGIQKRKKTLRFYTMNSMVKFSTFHVSILFDFSYFSYFSANFHHLLII